MDTGITGIWNDYPAYFCELGEWEDGIRYAYTLRQMPEAANSDVGLLGHMLHFTDLHLLVHCIPGLIPRMVTCGRLLTEGNVPHIPCGEIYEGHFYDAELSSSDLFDGQFRSDFESIFQIFTHPLSGTWRSVRTIDGVEEINERDIDVEFQYTETFYDAEDFKLYLMRSTAGSSSSTITLVERSDGDTEEYNFRMMGFHAMMEKNRGTPCLVSW